MRPRSKQPQPLFKTKAGEIEYYRAYEKTLTLWPVAFEEADVPTRFGSTHVIISGNTGSPPVVLLHSAQASSTMWFANIQALSARYRVYAVDFLFEAGKSIPKKSISTRQQLAEWLLEIFDYYRLVHPGVVGLSRGAWNGIVLASLFPRRVDKLVLISPAQAFTPITDLRFLYTVILCTFWPSKKHVRRMARLVIRKAPQVPELYLRQYECALRNFNIRNGVSLLPAVFTDAELRSLGMPCLLMIGDRDVVNTSASVERARSLLPAVETEIVAEAGHILTMDQPEYVNQRIMQFLSK